MLGNVQQIPDVNVKIGVKFDHVADRPILDQIVDLLGNDVAGIGFHGGNDVGNADSQAEVGDVLDDFAHLIGAAVLFSEQVEHLGLDVPALILLGSRNHAVEALQEGDRVKVQGVHGIVDDLTHSQIENSADHVLVDHVVGVAVDNVDQLLDGDAAVEGLKAAFLDEVIDSQLHAVPRKQVEHGIRDDIAAGHRSAGHIVDGAQEVVDDEMLHLLVKLSVENRAQVEFVEDRDDRLGNDSAGNRTGLVHAARKDVDHVEDIAHGQTGLLKGIGRILDESPQVDVVKPLRRSLDLCRISFFGQPEQIAEVDVGKRHGIVDDALNGQISVILNEGLVDISLILLRHLAAFENLKEQLVNAVKERADLDRIQEGTVAESGNDFVDAHFLDVIKQRKNARQIGNVISRQQVVLYV